MPAKPNVPIDQNLQAGLAARELAVRLVAGVLMQSRPLEQVLAEASAVPRFAALEARDRALARAVAATVLRRQGELEHVLGAFLERPLPRDQGRLWPILLAGAAQLVCLDMPAHAVVDLAVETTRRDRGAHRFAKLVNAVLRRVAERGPELLGRPGSRAPQHPGLAVAALERGLRSRHRAPHRRGEPARGAPRHQRQEPTPPAGPSGSAAACSRPARSASASHGRIEDLPGYAEGAWWVQDAGAALVARVAGDVAGRTVADLCAAPGGKTAALAAAGAQVTAVDVSRRAPRSPARQPEAPRARRRGRRGRRGDLVAGADLRRGRARRALHGHRHDPPPSRHPAPEAPGGRGPHGRSCRGACSRTPPPWCAPAGCSSTAPARSSPRRPSEQIAAFLAAHPDFQRSALEPAEIGAEPAWIDADGDLRTLPFHLPQEPADLSGIDGFYVARLRRSPRPSLQSKRTPPPDEAQLAAWVKQADCSAHGRASHTATVSFPAGIGCTVKSD